MSITQFKKQADKIGIISSFLCLVHCIALPILVSSHSLSTHAFHHHHDYHFLEYIFLAFSFVAVYFSTRNLSSIALKLSFYLVLAIFTLSFIFETSLFWLKYLGYAGSLGLISLHFFNWRKNRLKNCAKC